MYHSFKSLALATGTTALVFGAVASAQAYTVYTDRAAWQAAVDAIAGSLTTTDTFSTDIPKAQTITLDSGIVSTNSFPPDIDTIPFDNNAVLGGQYLNATEGDAQSASQTVTWTLPTSVFAFGADFFSTNPGALTLTGNFDGTGDQTLVVNDTIGGSDGFLGVIGTGNFSSVVFGNNSTDVDAFDIDDASFATVSQPPTVPEPSTVAALAVLGGSLLLNRQKKRN